MRAMVALGLASFITGCSTSTPLSLTPQKQVILNRSFNGAADCFYQRMAARNGAAISKAELPSQRASEVKMQLDSINRWAVRFAEESNNSTRATISGMETIWAGSAPSAAADLLPDVEACGS